MVLKKRIYDGGFHGLLAPVIPKAPRSLRRRVRNNPPGEDEINGFELLATVAENLLQEQESESSTSTIGSKGKEPVNINEPLEVKVKGEPNNDSAPLKESLHSENDSGSDHASIVTNSNFVKIVDTSLTMEAIEDEPDNIYDDEMHLEAVEEQSGGLTLVKTFDLDRLKPCVHLPFYEDRGNVNINIRSNDDDEKYFRYNNRNNTRLRAFGSRSRARYRRMRKMISSRYFPNSTIGVKSFYHKRKHIYMRERFQADAAIKRRKLLHQSSKISYIKEASNENMSNLVKFSIKSFKVPDLYVEVPESATVGSLKRSVMEAVKAVLHGELNVGVIVKGKKVRDDNKTLQQSGISQNCDLENLGFTLESSLPEVLPPSSPIVNHPPPVTSLDSEFEKNEESISFEAEGTTQEPVEDCKALVVVPPLNAVVPLSENSTKRYEFSQRRTRRPFSVLEVEALVEAVETLGAGRWRDVKMRAFDDADHRTYVDLKDKWKTLVHTASIAPQQRRGEPVPQNLLDRVLVAHAYWSQHQAKQHAKSHKTLEAQM